MNVEAAALEAAAAVSHLLLRSPPGTAHVELGAASVVDTLQALRAVVPPTSGAASALAAVERLYHEQRRAGSGDAGAGASTGSSVAAETASLLASLASAGGAHSAEDGDGGFGLGPRAQASARSAAAAATTVDYRYLPLLPTARELSPGAPEIDPSVTPNVTRGAYASPAHYLGTHFRLLREDCMAPLRAGLEAFRGHAASATSPPGSNSFADAFHRSCHDIRVYYDVRVLGARCTRSGIVYRLSFSAAGNRNVPWERSKRLLYGSLVVLSATGFAEGDADGAGSGGEGLPPMVSGIVADRDPRLLDASPRCIDVAFPGGLESQLRPDVSYTMAEATSTYYEVRKRRGGSARGHALASLTRCLFPRLLPRRIGTRSPRSRRWSWRTSSPTRSSRPSWAPRRRPSRLLRT